MGEFYDFYFNPILFTHAFALMGNDERRLGLDLGDYLNAVCNFFRRRGAVGHVQLDSGGPDFKRRAAENLGVGIGSLSGANERPRYAPSHQRGTLVTAGFSLGHPVNGSTHLEWVHWWGFL